MKGKKLCTLPAVVLSVVLLLTACGTKNERAAPAMSKAPSDTPAAEGNDYSSDELFGWTEVEEGQQESQSSSVYQNSGATLIREASLNVQTTEFDQAAANLETMVAQEGGYFQSAAVYGGSYRNMNADRSGEYTIRIPAERYEAFVGQAGTLGYVTSKNETTQNIGEQYYDTEARLKTQKTKQERLLALLEKAENMEDIISLEGALSDVEYQIEQLSATLNRYDSLVGYSTIYLYLNEVQKVSEEPNITDSLGDRIAAGIAYSAESLATGAQELLVWVSYHVFGLLIFAAAASVAAVTVRSVRGKKRRAAGKNQDETEQ